MSASSPSSLRSLEGRSSVRVSVSAQGRAAAGARQDALLRVDHQLVELPVQAAEEAERLVQLGEVRVEDDVGRGADAALDDVVRNERAADEQAEAHNGCLRKVEEGKGDRDSVLGFLIAAHGCLVARALAGLGREVLDRLPRHEDLDRRLSATFRPAETHRRMRGDSRR